eukprot:TRINITY_DN13080_c0_g1_i1.p1 TRINITY_DN13080_c0_g1~~TRINITY_DN13080_c0_g1_i1.p1  ORF type:complete len:305 (-),score=66.17 TRINITY_DN13080_c0_g1_i1:1557-2471(-)
MAKSLGNGFEQAADRLVSPNLLKLALSGNKVMAEAGHKAITNILEHVSSDKLLLRVASEITTKNPVLRNKCSTYLKCILGNYPVPIIDKYAAQLENALRIVLTDASAETRGIARESFILYETLFPAKAAKLYEALPLPSQKAICEAKDQEMPKERMLKKVSSYDDTQTSIEAAHEVPKEVRADSKKRSVYEMRPKKVMSLVLTEDYLSPAERSTKAKGHAQSSNQKEKPNHNKPSSDISPFNDLDGVVEGIKSEEPEKKLMALEELIHLIKDSNISKSESLKEAISLLIANISNVNSKVLSYHT